MEGELGSACMCVFWNIQLRFSLIGYGLIKPCVCVSVCVCSFLFSDFQRSGCSSDSAQTGSPDRQTHLPAVWLHLWCQHRYVVLSPALLLLCACGCHVGRECGLTQTEWNTMAWTGMNQFPVDLFSALVLSDLIATLIWTLYAHQAICRHAEHISVQYLLLILFSFLSF